MRKVLANKWTVPLLIFIPVLVIYIFTLSPSIYYGDSGELITAAYAGGIPHPPGFPLYAFISHLFTLLPGTNIAWKVNLFSAISGAFTVLLVYLSLLKITKNQIASVAASLLLAFSKTFWLYSEVAEVFMFNAMFFVLIIYLCLLFNEKPSNQKVFYLICFVFGLSLTAHQLNVFMGPALAVFFWFHRKYVLNLKNLILAPLLVVLGLFPYLYLPISASTNPTYYWGDLTTLNGIYRHIMRADFGFIGNDQGTATATEKISLSPLFAFYFSSFFTQFSVIGVALAFFGIFVQRKNKLLFLFFIALFIFIGPVFLYLTKTQMMSIVNKGIIERFFILSSIVFVLWIGVGIAEVLNIVKQKFLKEHKAMIMSFYVITIVLSLIIIPISIGYADQHQNKLFYDYGQNLMNTLPLNSVFIYTGEAAFMSSTYLTLVEKERPDVKAINFTLLPAEWYRQLLARRYPDFKVPEVTKEGGFLENALTICRDYVGKQPVFIDIWTGGFNPIENQECNFIRKGLVIELLPKNATVDVEDLKEENDALWRNYIDYNELPIIKPKDFRTRELMYYYSDSLTNLGLSYQEYGKTMWAKEAYTLADSISPDNGLSRSLLASILMEEKNYDEAIKLEEEAIKAQPASLGSYLNLGIIYGTVKKDNSKGVYYLEHFLELLPAGKYQNERDSVTRLIDQLKASE